MMKGHQNRPACRLCSVESGLSVPGIRIGVWLCKQHWRLLVELANACDLFDSALFRRDMDSVEQYANVQELLLKLRPPQ